MSQDKLNILFLDDDASYADSFKRRAAGDERRLHIKWVATGEECISELTNPKWDGFIFDAVGMMTDDDDPTLDTISNVMNIYERLDPSNKRPYAILTAVMAEGSKKSLVEEKLKFVIDKSAVFFKNEEENDLIEYLYNAMIKGDEFKFKLNNPKLHKVLNSEYFIDKKENYIANYLNIKKPDIIEKTNLEVEIHGMRNILEKLLNDTSEIYKVLFKIDVMKNKIGIHKKIEWLGGHRGPNNWEGEPRKLYVPGYIYASMNSINAIARSAGSHPGVDLPTKKTLDGLLFQTAEVLLWFGKEVMKKYQRKMENS